MVPADDSSVDDNLEEEDPAATTTTTIPQEASEPPSIPSSGPQIERAKALLKEFGGQWSKAEALLTDAKTPMGVPIDIMNVDISDKTADMLLHEVMLRVDSKSLAQKELN